MPQDVGEPGSQEATQGALEALSALPIGAHLTVVLAVLVGLALWLFGRKLAKPAFLIVGALLGAAAGFLLLPGLGVPAIAGIPSPYLGLGLGAAAGLIVSGFVFRFTMALASAGVMGLAALLISSIYVTAYPPSPETAPVATPALASIAPPLTLFQLRLPEYRPRPGGPSEASSTVGRAMPVALRWRQPADETTDPLPAPPPAPGIDPAAQPDAPPVEAPGSPETLGDAAERVRSFLEALSGEIQAIWTGQSEQGQLIVLGSTVIGAALGFLIGLGAPNRAAIVITSMAGAAIWLPSAVVLLHALEIPAREALVFGPRGWLIAWMGASIVGVGSQLVLTRKPDDSEQQKPAS